MRFYKLIGLFLLFAAGVFCGVSLRAYFRRRCRQAEAFLSLLRYYRFQVDCFSAPERAILASFDRGLLAECGAEGAARPADLGALLRSARLYLPEEMSELLFSLSGELGGTYRAEQVRCIDHYIARFTPLCEELKRELPKWEKLALVLPLSLSAALMLLLW